MTVSQVHRIRGRSAVPGDAPGDVRMQVTRPTYESRPSFDPTNGHVATFPIDICQLPIFPLFPSTSHLFRVFLKALATNGLAAIVPVCVRSSCPPNFDVLRTKNVTDRRKLAPLVDDRKFETENRCPPLWPFVSLCWQCLCFCYDIFAFCDGSSLLSVADWLPSVLFFICIDRF